MVKCPDGQTNEGVVSRVNDSSVYTVGKNMYLAFSHSVGVASGDVLRIRLWS